MIEMVEFKVDEKRLGEMKELSVDSIVENPFQPRRVFEPMALVELTDSIRQYGLIQPILVRAIDGGMYELVAGERRFRACKLAEKTHIPAIITQISNTDSAILAMVENLQRQDLNFIEEAEGIAKLINQHDLTQEELAKKLGRNQSTIANKLRLLRLPRSIARRIITNGLSERHARAFLKIDATNHDYETSERMMLEVLEIVIDERLNVAKTEALVEDAINGKLNKKEKKKKKKVRLFFKDMRLFKNTIKQAVDTMTNSGIDAKYDLSERDDGMDIIIEVKY